MTNGVFANWEWWCDDCNASSTEGDAIHNRAEALASWKEHKASALHKERVQ